jgi:hypothetical protein
MKRGLETSFFINKFIKELTEDMSRITGNEVQGLMEAYNEVYASQELTEEQVWEEVENWVYSLVEEGYDLSDYTWEDMYESYIEEQGRGRVTGSNPNVFKPTPSGAGSRRGAAPVPSSSSISSTGSVTSRPGTRTGSNPNVFKPTPSGAGSRRGAAPLPSKPTPTPAAKPPMPGLPPSARQVTQYPAGVSTGVSGGNAGASPAPAPKPAARPATTAPARPAARPTATTPASAKPKPSIPSAPPPPTSAPSAPPPPTAKRPSLASQADELRQMRAASQQRQAAMLKQSFDLYDIIKGHLIDEGYADTEEAAEAIMVSMSEDWRESILEQVTGTGEGRPMEGDTPGNVGPTPPPKVHGGKGSGPKGKHPMPPPVTPPPSVK